MATEESAFGFLNRATIKSSKGEASSEEEEEEDAVFVSPSILD
jgi:hypothetical protein